MGTKVQTTTSRYFYIVLYWGGLALITLMPVHAFVVIVLGHLFGHQVLFQAWKEVLILIMVTVAGFLAFKNRKHFADVFKKSSNQLALAILLLGFFYVLYSITTGSVESSAILFGVKTTLLPFTLFLAIQFSSLERWQESVLEKIVLIPAAIVAIGALIQTYLLPTNWLANLGYNATTILSVQLVDPAVKSIRAFSTLGGPNQLGAYLILPILYTTILLIRKRKLWYLLVISLTIWAMALSFSRSAWLGLIAGGVALLFLMLKLKARLIAGGLMATIVLLGYILISSGFAVRTISNSPLQYYLFHGQYSQQSVSFGSDTGRISSLQAGINLVKQHPAGLGIGSVGPASFHGSKPIITENWYMQIALELGLIGLCLVVGFFIVTGGFLARTGAEKASPLAVALCASLIGLGVTNLFLHAWADSTLAIITFTLLGIMRGQYDKA